LFVRGGADDWFTFIPGGKPPNDDGGLFVDVETGFNGGREEGFRIC
jgi:hypothetical protein